MRPDDVRSLYAYDEWANARFVAVIDSLDEGQLEARIESSFPSVLGTLAHIVAAEWVWLRRWLGESPSSFPAWLEDPSRDDLKARLAAVESERDAFLGQLDEASLQASLAYRTLDGTPHETRLQDLLLHVVNHSSYHRGQLTTMLRQVGAEPPASDYVLFKRL